MSSPLAIAAVSAVLRNLLDNGLIDAGAALGTRVHVSAVAPDTIDLQAADEPPRLNLFLYQVQPNAAWRNAGLPARDPVRGDRLANAPLAIDLHYLLTAYGRADCQAEILLGYAMHLLHERPVLDRAAIRRALDADPLDLALLPPAYQALAAADLADQLELVKVVWNPTGLEESARLWSALQRPCRPSVTYQASVLLIEGTRPTRAPLPVLSRGEVDPDTRRDRGVVVQADLGPPLPTLLGVRPRLRRPALRLGDEATLVGVRLAGSGHVARLSHRLLDQPRELPLGPPDATGTKMALLLPDDAAAQHDWPAGPWTLSLRFTPAGESRPRETNAVPLMLAPQPVLAADAAAGLPAPALARSASPPGVSVTLACRPRVRPQQRASLMLGTHEALAEPRTAADEPLRFAFPASLPAGLQRLRLRVDGVDSLLLDRSGPQPRFDDTQQLAVPA